MAHEVLAPDRDAGPCGAVPVRVVVDLVVRFIRLLVHAERLFLVHISRAHTSNWSKRMLDTTGSKKLYLMAIGYMPIYIMITKSTLSQCKPGRMGIK